MNNLDEFLKELDGRGFNFMDKTFDEFGFKDEILNMVYKMYQAGIVSKNNNNVNTFDIGQRVFVLDEAYCYDYENNKGYVGSYMFKKYGTIVDIREEVYGEVGFGNNYLIEIPSGQFQWVAEECLIESE